MAVSLSYRFALPPPGGPGSPGSPGQPPCRVFAVPVLASAAFHGMERPLW